MWLAGDAKIREDSWEPKTAHDAENRNAKLTTIDGIKLRDGIGHSVGGCNGHGWS